MPVATRARHRPRIQAAPVAIEVRRSTVHGTGVFASEPIRRGSRIIEYTGRRRPWKEAQNDPPRDPANPYHTFLFTLEDGNVIDAGDGGNDARWINHSCEPNCITRERKGGRIFIYALRDIAPGEELFYDYKLVPAERRTKKLEQEFRCVCGTPSCRGTMLEPK